MLYAIVAKPGQGKSYFAVTKMYDFQQTNIENVKKNVPIYYENKKILEDRAFLKKDYTFKYELGEKTYEFTCNYKYFEVFENEEQFEEYFEYFFYYNHYIDQVIKQEGITLTKIFPVRQIYSDINGLKIQGVLPCDIDWRKTPMGSICFIDEVRKKPPYNFTGNAPSKDPIIIDMAMVRHTDKDVWLITQDSKDYNVSLRQLIDKMYFVKRPPQNPQACGIYVFDQWLSNPRAAADSQRDPKKYVEHFTLVYKKKFQRMYTSASSHTSMKFRIPWKVFAYIFLFLLIVTIVLVGFLKIPVFQYFGGAIKQMTGQEKNPVSQLSNPMGHKPQVNALDKRCSEQYGLTIEQCADLRDPEKRNKENLEKNKNDMENIVVNYNPNKPYDLADIQTDTTYSVTSKPVFSGCMTNKNGTYTAYTQQGTKIDVIQADCETLINNAGSRPFDYFRDTQRQDVNINQMQTQQLQQFQPYQPMGMGHQITNEEYAKYQQAKEQGLI